ncbi:leucyl aminopeptidase [Sphingomonas laterariae]|uniref:Probable cytosol aminopeptidase n=1 Tax=Edaphosphingomonas laterariae TaxID=861865 RepID=A0A239HEW6_9SPHN|nr:leucyl aminopeptidase [Sphingomonas laterariae]SNS79681.1 leucyl aminopeptidase [Sphingomonas laterariae]
MRLFAAAMAATMLSTPVSAAPRPIAYAAAPASTGTIVLPLASADDLAVRGATLAEADRAAIARALTAAAFDYKARSTLSLRGIGGHAHILVIGMGKAAPLPADLQDIGGLAAQKTSADDGPVALVATGLGNAAAGDLALGATLGGYGFDKYHVDVTPAKPGQSAALTIVTAEADAARKADQRDVRALADAVAFTRDLVSEPANIIYPESFVARTQDAFRGLAGASVEVLDVPALERLGMGGILGVGQGSRRPPRLLIVSYKGTGAPAQPIALAGKGITFDSGGISIKGGTGMWEMKTDMAGAAAVVGTVLSLAKRGAPVNVVAFAALAENMPGGGATRPGDVLKTYSGKTIEVVNTDAEGRVVLADAVAYADKRYNPSAIIDVATLTGAVGRALGDEYAGLFSRHDALAGQLVAAGKATGELLWQLPLHASYAKDVKSDIADVRNSTEGRNPGAGHGAQFIGYFIDPATPWAHIDIASTAWTSEEQPTARKGATGYAVRLLDRFVRDYQPVPRGAGEGGK